MNRLLIVTAVVLLCTSSLFIACSSSEETQQEKEATNRETPQQEQVMSSTTETSAANEAAQTTEQPKETESMKELPKETISSSSEGGTYAVQIGAYKMTNKAEEIAAIARQRFNMTVTTFEDKESGLTKVLVGAFTTKEEARTFRDQLAKQYPEEYNDAWVTEKPRD